MTTEEKMKRLNIFNTIKSNFENKITLTNKLSEEEIVIAVGLIQHYQDRIEYDPINGSNSWYCEQVKLQLIDRLESLGLEDINNFNCVSRELCMLKKTRDKLLLEIDLLNKELSSSLENIKKLEKREDELSWVK